MDVRHDDSNLSSWDYNDHISSPCCFQHVLALFGSDLDFHFHICVSNGGTLNEQ